MKKTYMTPLMRVVQVKQTQLLCASPMTLGNSRQEEVDYDDAGFQ